MPFHTPHGSGIPGLRARLAQIVNQVVNVLPIFETYRHCAITLIHGLPDPVKVYRVACGNEQATLRSIARPLIR